VGGGLGWLGVGCCSGKAQPMRRALWKKKKKEFGRSGLSNKKKKGPEGRELGPQGKDTMVRATSLNDPRIRVQDDRTRFCTGKARRKEKGD